MILSTIVLLFGTGIWAPGLESLSDDATPAYQISPMETPWETTPLFSARAVLLLEAKSMTPVFEYNAHAKLPMASLTKMMTALIILENHDLSETVVITRGSSSTDGSTMKLVEGETLTVEDLLKGLLMNSGNDAAIALALHHSKTVFEFANVMNTRAAELRMNNTHFTNPHGLDSDTHYASAYNLAVLAKVLLQSPKAASIVGTKDDMVVSLEGEEKHYLSNTNELLGTIFPVYGIKTGTTANAGQCLALFVEEDGKQYILIILGSEDRYLDAKTLLYTLLGDSVL